MVKLAQFNTINQILEEGDVEQEKRDYLGYSGVGGKCMRKVWYSFRWADDVFISRRVERIFRRGDLEEERIINDLSRVGCTVTDVQREVIGITGHARGHIDGIIIGVPTAVKTKHLLESKTMKAAQYAKYIKEGLQRFSSTYWQQIHSYMGHCGLKRCLYVCVNKDTEERDFKRIEFDRSQFEEGERIAFNIITSESAPNRLPNSSRTYFECRICGYNEICHQGKEVARNCRTCKYWDIEDGGKFSCSNPKWHQIHNKKIDIHFSNTLTKERQLKACSKYEMDECYK